MSGKLEWWCSFLKCVSHPYKFHCLVSLPGRLFISSAVEGICHFTYLPNIAYFGASVLTDLTAYEKLCSYLVCAFLAGHLLLLTPRAWFVRLQSMMWTCTDQWTRHFGYWRRCSMLKSMVQQSVHRLNPNLLGHVGVSAPVRAAEWISDACCLGPSCTIHCQHWPPCDNDHRLLLCNGIFCFCYLICTVLHLHCKYFRTI